MKHFSLLDRQISGVRWGSGRKILAFHGFLDNAMSFAALAECLDDIEIWAIDLPGHGQSTGLPETDGLFLLQWLPKLGEILDELGWPEVEIIGHSMGAILAQLLAAVDPRVRCIYCLDALGPLASTDEENFNRFHKLYKQRGQLMPVRYYGSYEQIVNSRLKGMFPLSLSAASTMAKRALGLAKRGWFHRYNRRLRQESLWRLSEAEALIWLGNIECPVELAVFGADQWPGYQGVFERRKQAVKTLNVVELRGSHHLHMENPTLIAQWLNSRLLLK